jgi:hypothetical protein
VLHFFDAGTSNTRTVYSNYGLSTSLGVTVTCDSGGFPTSDGSSKVEIYTGNTPYKVVLKDSSANTIWTLDNVIAALDTSSFLTDPDIVPSNPVTNSSSNQAPVVGDKGNFYNLNCSGGDITVTFDDSATLGDGWFIYVRHDGTANQILFLADGSELFKIGGHAGVGAFAATQRGETYKVNCDGTGFKVEQTSPALFNTTGVIVVADRLSTPASSPQAGARYIVGSAPTGAWSGFAEFDIAEASGQSTWFKITPPTNSGWIAYVQDEARHYFHYTSGWALQVNKQAGVYLVEEGAISAASSLDVNIPTDADEVELILMNLIPGTDAQVAYLRFGQSSSFLSGAGDYQWERIDNATLAGSAADTEIEISLGIGTNTNERFTTSIRIFKPNLASFTKTCTFDGGGRMNDGSNYVMRGWGEFLDNTNAIDSLRIIMASGTIASGRYALMARRYA